MTKKILALILAAVALTALLPSCSGEGSAADGDKNAASGEPVAVVSGGATEYVVVRSDIYDSANVIVQSAVALRNAISAVTGADMAIKTDWDGSEDNTLRREILVGDTNRQESADALSELEDGQFVVKVCGDGTKIVVTGKTERTTEYAVRYFLNTYLKYFSDEDFTANSDFTLTLGLSDIQVFAGSAGTLISAGSDAEKAIIYQDAGNVSDGARALERTDVLIYKLTGTAGAGYSLSLDLEGEYLVTASTDNATFYRLLAYTDDGLGTARGTYTADLTTYFSSSDTVYIRITDYHPLDGNSPAIYSLTLSETDDQPLG